MKKVKTYIVFKNYVVSGLADIYYVGRSKRTARKEFRQLAEPFLLNRYVDTTKLVFAEVVLDKADYDFLSEEYDNFNSQKLVNEILSSIVYDETFTEIDMVNHLTFDLDFLPYFCKTEHIHPLDLKVEGVLDKLIAEPNNCLHKRLKKYLKKNF